MDAGRNRLIAVTLADDGRARGNPTVEHERAVALRDLVHESSFALVRHPEGPYALHLALRDGRLVLDVRDAEGRRLEEIVLPLAPLRSLIRDYFRVCAAHDAAIRTASRVRIEAIDMGRRGLHDEGAERLRERLAGRVRMDAATGRRLFTLICVLHARAWSA